MNCLYQTHRIAFRDSTVSRFFRAMLSVSAAYAVMRCLSVTFVYCVESAKDTAIVGAERE